MHSNFVLKKTICILLSKVDYMKYYNTTFHIYRVKEKIQKRFSKYIYYMKLFAIPFGCVVVVIVLTLFRTRLCSHICKPLCLQ